MIVNKKAKTENKRLSERNFERIFEVKTLNVSVPLQQLKYPD